MRRAAGLLIGTHDFAAFHTGRSKKSTVRRIDTIDISRAGAELQISISGNGFLYNMVRIIVGTLVQVGLGKTRPEEIAEILESRDRSRSGPTAPAQGLILWETKYENRRTPI